MRMTSIYEKDEIFFIKNFSREICVANFNKNEIDFYLKMLSHNNELDNGLMIFLNFHFYYYRITHDARPSLISHLMSCVKIKYVIYDNSLMSSGYLLQLL